MDGLGAARNQGWSSFRALYICIVGGENAWQAVQTLETMGRSIKRIIAQIFIAAAEFLGAQAVGGSLKPISNVLFHYASFLC